MDKQRKYNEEAEWLDGELQGRCPLLHWYVLRYHDLTCTEIFPNPTESFFVKISAVVNDEELIGEFSFARDIFDGIKTGEMIDYLIRQVSSGLVEGILEWRPVEWHVEVRATNNG